MKFYLSTAISLTVLIGLSGCQTTNNEANTKATVNERALPLAAAVQVRYQDEVNLLRIDQLLLNQKELPTEQRARLFYQRALIYDRMGLNGHSRYDLSQTLSLDPSFAPAYNTLGLYYLLIGSFNEALESFDSALELSDNMQYSYLHRAIGLYEIGRYSLASKDIESFYGLDKSDPYRILWRYIINSKVDQTRALNNLKAAQKLNKDKRFAWLIVDVIAGRLNEKDFLHSISYGVTKNEALAQRLCEAYFYLGSWHKIKGNINKAIYYFKLSTATNIHDFIEYKYALIELASIQRMINAKPAN